MRRAGHSVQRKIKQMVHRIVRQFHPERVILFGSHARGEGGPDSDVDLLVVMPVEGLKHKKQIQIRVALRDIRVPKDVIVTTPADFEWRKEVPGTIEYPAAREGKVLYARRALVAAEWVAKAEDDLRNAAHTLGLGRTCPTGTVCFHAQQCVEKYLKAYLVCQGVYFPKTHDIDSILTNSLLRSNKSLQATRRITAIPGSSSTGLFSPVH